SGSKRFLLTMMSVLVKGLVGAAVFSPAVASGAGLEGAGKSHGPSFHERYARQPTRPMAAASRMLSNDDRVKIAILYKYSWSKTARQVTPFGKQGQISAKVYSFAPALKTKNCAAMRRPAPRQGWV